MCEDYADSGYVEGPLCYGGAIKIHATQSTNFIMVNSIVRGNYDIMYHDTDSAYTVFHNFAVGNASASNPIVLAYSNFVISLEP